MSDPEEINFSSILKQLQTGKPSPKDLESSSHLWSSLKIAIGGLIVRGYRILKYKLEQECIIFIKKDGINSLYLYMKVQNSENEEINSAFFEGLKESIYEVNKMRKNEAQKYSVYILYVTEYSTIEIKSCPDFEEILKNKQHIGKKELICQINEKFVLCENFRHNYSPEEIVLINNEEEQRKIKDIVFSYIDTFGQKIKLNFYKELNKKALFLINTINTIVFEETRNKIEENNIYNQIESCCWTLFKDGNLKSDRKDIVFSGNSKVLILDLIIVKSFWMHISQEYKHEVQELFFECEKAYNETKIKVVRIENNLTNTNIYTYQMKPLGKSSKSEKIDITLE